MTSQRLAEAHAVHLPPGDRESCVGIALRLSDGSSNSEAERKGLAGRLSEDDVRQALAPTGFKQCTDRFERERTALGLGPDSSVLELGYGVDSGGRVCAVVEHDRPAPIDPRARSLFELAAACGKDALFRAQFPEGLVEGKERLILMAYLPLTHAVATATSSERRGDP